MQCPKCQTENREGARFCGSCGASLLISCPACGVELVPGLRFCDACGRELAALSPGASSLDHAIRRLVPIE
ncbi:MAG: zinc-ribbon domain-containing protein, partial [Anaerolineae bacterium]|nr:zinc-ribbon domain-containing protein [Anaerolineae bacterium]